MLTVTAGRCLTCAAELPDLGRGHHRKRCAGTCAVKHKKELKRLGRKPRAKKIRFCPGCGAQLPSARNRRCTACAKQERLRTDREWKREHAGSRAKLRRCLSCARPIPKDVPKQQRRCPGTCAEAWKKGRPKRDGYRNQRRYAQRQGLVLAIIGAITTAQRRKREADLELARDAYMKSLTFTHTSTMEIFAGGRYWKIGGRKL